MLNKIFSGFKRYPLICSLFVSSVVLTLAVLVTYLWNFGSRPLSSSVEKWGQFGDYIGGVLNPSLAFISVVLVCMTLYSTSKQSSVQSFESILFELLRFHKDNLSGIKVEYSEENKYTGRDALSYYMMEIKFNLSFIVDDSLPLNDRLKESVDMVYMEDNNFSNVGHYFRNIYHIYKHIDDSDVLSEKEKIKYAKLVRAQISSIESGALLLNGYSTAGLSAKKYIEKYSLLQGFSLINGFKNQLDVLGALEFYSDIAYKDKKGQ